MNKQKESKLNMYDAVIAYCNSNPAIVATVPAFQTALASFQATVDEIHSTAQLEANVITGIAIDKAQLKASLCQQAADLAAVIFAFASGANNNELKEQVSFAPSELKHLKDEMLAPTCTNIRDAANANLLALAAYGITAATIADFQTAIDAYTAKLSSPRNAVSQRSAYSKSLSNLFTATDAALKDQLDKIAVQFKAANQDFYDAYKNNRIIIDPGSSSTQIAGTVAGTSDSQPVSGATVQEVGQSATATTNALGFFALKSLSPGTYSIKITSVGFADKQIDNLVVKLGRTTHADVAIDPLTK